MNQSNIIEKARSVRGALENEGYDVELRKGSSLTNPVVEFEGSFITVAVEDNGQLALTSTSGDGYIYTPVENVQEIIEFIENKYQDPLN